MRRGAPLPYVRRRLHLTFISFLTLSQTFLRHCRRRNSCKSPTNAPGSAPRVLVDSRDCEGGKGGVASRRHCARCVEDLANFDLILTLSQPFSAPFHRPKNANLVSNAPRSAPEPLTERCDCEGGGLGSLRGAARSAAAPLPRRCVGDIVELGSKSDILNFS